MQEGSLKKLKDPLKTTVPKKRNDNQEPKKQRSVEMTRRRVKHEMMQRKNRKNNVRIMFLLTDLKRACDKKLF